MATTTETVDKDEHDDHDEDAEHEHEGVHMHDAYVRAMEEGSDMTAIFGEIHNSTDKDIVVTGFKANVDAKMFQIHEVEDGVMQEKKGGIELKAGESEELEPGGDHFMLMGVSTPIMAGESIDLTLLLADGSEIEVHGIPARSIGAGAEGYDDMHDDMHGDMHDDMKEEHK